jgi:hypothetical protein
MSSFQTELSASSAVLDASASVVLTLNGVDISFNGDVISDDLMTYTDNEILEYEPLLYPKAKKVFKILGGKLVVSEDCFIPFVDGDDECCVNGDDCCFNDDYEGEKLMFKGLCECKLRECKDCFLERVSKQFYNNYENTRCLSNHHKGRCYCKLVKQEETKITITNHITAQQIKNYRQEKKFMDRMKEYTYDIYEANVKGKEFNDLPLCFQIFKNLCDRVEKVILTHNDLDLTIDKKKQYYFFEDQDTTKPIKWGMAGYDWEENDNWEYGQTTFYVLHRDKGNRRFITTKIRYEEEEQIEDMLEDLLINQPLYYGASYAFDLLKHNFQLALGNSYESDAFRRLAEDTETYESLIGEMVDGKKIRDVCRNIIANDDVNICELMGCESLDYDAMEGHDGTDYYICYYDDDVALQDK